MGSKPPSTQTITQKTEIDPIQKAFLFGTPLPADYKEAFDARNRRIMGMGDPEPVEPVSGVGQLPIQDRSSPDFYTPENQARMYELEQDRGGGGRMANGGLVGLANGGMVPPMMGGGMPDLSNRETAYLMGLQALQGALQPRMGYALGGYIEGPGTGRSDSIPATIYQNGQPVQEAALSDGEFVMTERAVRGAGGGDREAGAARMYAMMRRFESGGKVS